MAFGLPSAPMGFVGYCQFLMSGTSTAFPNRYQVRATGCDLRLSQAIAKPEITDIRYDRNVYTVMPEEIGGTISFPVVLYDAATRIQTKDLTAALYEAATLRNYQGRLSSFDVAVKYSHSDAEYIYQKCYVNTFKFSVEQGSTIDIGVDVIGKYRIEDSFSPKTVHNSRIATWNDVIVRAAGEVNIPGRYLRRFEANINNNIERIYTANGKLQAQDLTPRQRDVDGTFTVMGRYPQLARYSRDNPARCIEESYLEFGYAAPCSVCDSDGGCSHSSGGFAARLPNIVYEVEEISSTNDVLETVVKWHSIPTNHNLAALNSSILTALFI